MKLDISFGTFEKKNVMLQMKYSLKKLFSRVYEQRNKFRYVIEKGVQGKNNVTFDLWLCLITKFNGCAILKAQTKGEKKTGCAN